eukprot:TRINITY_DN9341_c0_g1_i11.p2 TRINITY_DN9341_c0_g1~~TRINITY_DN9341_c0_g1_i11.p2  ORF type:complete len:117 (+),score=12.19 TRINITY_DN9341_c0_g1_i11:114-464(+)
MEQGHRHTHPHLHRALRCCPVRGVPPHQRQRGAVGFTQATYDNTLKLWNKDTGTWNKDTGALIRNFTGHTGPVTCAAFHPTNNSEVLSGSSDKTLKLWHKDTGALIRNFTGHSNYV